MNVIANPAEAEAEAEAEETELPEQKADDNETAGEPATDNNSDEMTDEQ